MLHRRNLLAALAAAPLNSAAQQPPTVLLRSGWQSVNIGDVTHTPGVLTLLEKHIPEARVILWPAEIERGVEPMLLRRFPKLTIVKGNLDGQGQPATPELKSAFAAATFCIHGSGPSVVGPQFMQAWKNSTGKPYGFLGIGFTLTGDTREVKGDEDRIPLLKDSRFAFTRETASLANLKKAGINGPTLGFCPDSTFSFDILDEPRAEAWLQQNNLEPGKFIAVIPRLRMTPYHLIRKTNYTPQEIERRTTVNEKWAEPDHAKFREAIIAYVRKSGNKVLLCPEMTYQIDILEPLLYRPLPEDVKPHVVLRKSYWLSDEAASIYKRAALVLSFECHSPIIAAAVGTPCIYVHQPEDGIKGQMYPDIGLTDWYFQAEKDSGAAIASRVLDITGNPAKSAQVLRKAVSLARSKQKDALDVVHAALGRA